MATIFTKERLILCEGSSDKAFFCELIRKRGLPEFQIQFPYKATETTGGIDKFGRFLLGNINEEFLSIVKAVLIVADNDEDHQTQFNRIRDQLRNTGYGIPSDVLQFVKSYQGLPPIGIMMLPLNKQCGNLETICKQAAFTKWAELESPLEVYLEESPAKDWDTGKQDKMRIQCIIAATCETNPYSTIPTHFREAEKYHIPLDAPCLDDIANVLRDFDQMVQNAR